MIKYIGSKRELLPKILDTVAGLRDVKVVLDPFSGTARVGRALKEKGYRVFASDHNAYAATLATCYVESDVERIEAAATPLIRELNTLTGRPGYFTETFCERSRYVHPKNGERIDAMREWIAERELPRLLRAVLLTSLMEAADRVDSTTGLQMAYLKSWAKRAHNDIELRMPVLATRSPYGESLAMHCDVEQALGEVEADLVYLDPPYNQHSYLGNYHVWESLVLWDKPEVYGIACKRVDCKERKSDFNSKRKFREAFERMLGAVRSRYVLVSFNNEGFIDFDSMVSLLSSIGEVSTQDIDYKRYVGAQIGIHNLKGEKVGRVSHLRNKEHLFLVRRKNAV